MEERDWKEIARVAGAVLLVALIVGFSLDNRRSVDVGFIFFDRRAPLIWVLLFTALFGALAGALIRRLRKNKN